LSPLRRIARNAAPVATTSAVGELLERETARDQLPFELRLTLRARRAVLEFVRGVRVARAVHQEARATFTRGRPNQPHRFGATHEQPDCFDESGDQAAGSLPDSHNAGNGGRNARRTTNFLDLMHAINKEIPAVKK
jgi:hypothetical protein